MKHTAWHLVLLIAFAFIFNACDTSTPTPPPTPTITRLEITPGGLLLTKAGESQVLSAKAFDAENHEVQATFTWTSSHPANATVDSSGKVTAVRDLGSAQLTAQVGNVKAMAMVMIAEPVTGAVLIPDARIVGALEEIIPEQNPNIGTQYSVALSEGASPDVGSILLSGGAKPLAGKVLTVTPNGSGFKVVLERRPVTELFNKISLNLQGTLGDAETGVANQTEVVQPKASGVPKATSKPIAVGPFLCEAKAEIKLIDKSFKIEIQRTMNYDFVLNTNFTEISQFRFKVEGSIAASATGNIEIGGKGSVGLTCKYATPKVIPIPVSGALAVILSPVAKLGMTFSVGGDVKLTAVQVGLKGELKATLTLGMDYTPEKGFVNLSEFKPENTLKPSFTSPDDPQLEFNGEMSFQGTIGLGFGNTLASLSILEYAFGPAVSLKYKPAAMQALGDDASSYSLSLKDSLAPSEEFKDALKKVFSASTIEKLNILQFSLSGEIAVASSPTKEGEVSVDLSTYKKDDKLTFQVALDPANINFFPFVYNVKAIKIYYKNNAGVVDEIASLPATDGQKEFTLEWKASEDGTVDKNFFAFVQPEFGEFLALELGMVGVKANCEAPVGVKYCIIDLEGIATAEDINDEAQVIGNTSTKGFLWRDGKITEVKLSGFTGSYETVVHGINNSGQIVGRYINDSESSYFNHAFLWVNEQMIKLESLGSHARAINNTGTVVGYGLFGATPELTEIHASVWNSSQIFDLGTLGNLGNQSCESRSNCIFSEAVAINDMGEIVGTSFDWGIPTNKSCAIVWKNGQISVLTTSSNSEALAINNVGQIVGLSLVQGSGSHAFLWHNGQEVDLGTLGGSESYASGINDSGEIVGVSMTNIFKSPIHPFLWKNGVMLDLNSMIEAAKGWELLRAKAINNKGQIIGQGMFNGKEHAYLLTPVQP